MFVNKNVKSLKNVKKINRVNSANSVKYSKMSKKNIINYKLIKSKKYNKYNNTIYNNKNSNTINHMIGGSTDEVYSTEGILTKQTLISLLNNTDNEHTCIIKYKGITIYCVVGSNMLKLGGTKNDSNTHTIKACIILSYVFSDNTITAKLESFFYHSEKNECLISKTKSNDQNNKRINNNEFYKQYTNKNTSYEKTLNILLLDLIDEINILLGVKTCVVDDASSVECKDSTNKLSLKSKHITRGYGFYNEFGYLYKHEKNVLIGERIIFANKILSIIKQFSEAIQIFDENTLRTLFNKDNKDNKDIDDIITFINLCLSKVGFQFTYKNILQEIENLCKVNTTPPINKKIVLIIPTIIQLLIDYINKEDMRNPLITDLKTFTKYYTYSEESKKSQKSIFYKTQFKLVEHITTDIIYIEGIKLENTYYN